MSLDLGTAYASLELRLQRMESEAKRAPAIMQTMAANVERIADTLNKKMERDVAASATRVAAAQKAALDRQEKQLAASLKRQRDELTQSLAYAGQRLTIGLTLPLAALGTAAVKSAVEMDSLKRGLRSVAGSSDEAERQLKRLKEVAKLPGLGFNEAIAGSTRLQAAGISARTAERALMGFGNALATVGRGKADLDGVITALSQIQSKGVISAEEINQIAERVPQIRRVMIDAFGTANTEILQKAKLTSDEFIGTITDALEKLPKVTGGAQNSFENFGDAAKRALTAIGDSLLPIVTRALEKFIPILEDIAANFGKLPDIAKTALGGLALGGALIGPALLGLSSLAGAIKNINDLLKGSILARLLGGASGATIATVGAASYLGYRALSTGVTEEQAARAMRKEREDYLALAKSQGPEALRKAEQRVSELYPIRPARVSGMGAVRAVEGATAERIPENKRLGFIDVAARAAAAKAAKEAAEEAKRFAKEQEEARKRNAVEMAAFRNKFSGQRVQAEQDFRERIPTLGITGASNWLKARLAEIQNDEDAERKALNEASKRRIEEARRRVEVETKEAKSKRTQEIKDRTEFMKRVQETFEAPEKAMRAKIQEGYAFDERVKQLHLKNMKAFDEQETEDRKKHLQRLREGVEFEKRVNETFNAPIEAARKKNIQANKDAQAFQERVMDTARRNRVLPEQNIERIKDQIQRSLGGTLGIEVAYGFVDSFADGLEKAFGRSSIGKAFARGISRWLDKEVGNLIGSVLDKLAKGGKGASGGGGAGVLGAIFPMLGIGAAIGGLFKGLKFAEGGWVPGPIGQPQPATVHGGEFVVSRNMMQNGGIGGSVTVNLGGVTISGDYDVDRMMDRISWHAKRRLAVNPGSG